MLADVRGRNYEQPVLVTGGLRRGGFDPGVEVQIVLDHDKHSGLAVPEALRESSESERNSGCSTFFTQSQK